MPVKIDMAAMGSISSAGKGMFAAFRLIGQSTLGRGTRFIGPFATDRVGAGMAIMSVRWRLDAGRDAEDIDDPVQNLICHQHLHETAGARWHGESGFVAR